MTEFHPDESFYKCHNCPAIFLPYELVEGRPPEHNISGDPNETTCLGSWVEADMVIPRIVVSP